MDFGEFSCLEIGLKTPVGEIPGYWMWVIRPGWNFIARRGERFALPREYPTLCGETAKDGAPVRFGRFDEQEQQQLQKQIPFGDDKLEKQQQLQMQRRIQGFFASLRMTTYDKKTAETLNFVPAVALLMRFEEG